MIICDDVEIDESKDDYFLGLYLTNVHSCMNEIDFRFVVYSFYPTTLLFAASNVIE